MGAFFILLQAIDEIAPDKINSFVCTEAPTTAIAVPLPPGGSIQKVTDTCQEQLNARLAIKFLTIGGTA